MQEIITTIRVSFVASVPPLSSKKGVAGELLHGSELSSRGREYFKFTDPGLVGGLECNFWEHRYVSARYNHGIKQIAEEGMGFEMKKQVPRIRIGYLF